MQEIFGPCGNIKRCRVIVDAEGNSRGFGFVDFENVDGAKNAIKKSGEKYDGRQINVEYSLPKNMRENGGNQRGGNRGGRGGRG